MPYFQGDLTLCPECKYGVNGNSTCTIKRTSDDCGCPNGRPLPNLPKEKKPNKYRNNPCDYDGIHFDSEWERERYIELRLAERAGEISGLKVKPRYELIVNGVKICERGFYPDFEYISKDGIKVVEDTKSKATMTKVYQMKKNLLKALYNLDVKEIVKG